MSKPFAVIYDRASSRKQAGNWSRKDAEVKGRELAEKHGYAWELRREVKSGEGLLNRPVMMQILDEIEAGKIQAIICQELSRLSRDSDSLDGYQIRKTCKDNGVLVITQNRVYDFDNNADDMTSDMEFLAAKLQKKLSNEQTVRGQTTAAKAGRFLGGIAPLGYILVYPPSGNPSQKPVSDLAIDESQTETVKAIFEYFIKYGATRGAIELNEAGYRKPNGKPFHQKDMRRIVSNPLYAGFMTWGRNAKSRLLKGFEATMIHRPELQIVSVDTWQAANKERKARSQRRYGSTAKHPFSGIVKCPLCGGPMYGKKWRRTTVVYRCANRDKYGREKCPSGSMAEGVIARGIIPFLADVITNHMGLDEAINGAAQTYGVTHTEAQIEEATKAELHAVGEQKNRVIKAIASGVATEDEARSELDDLRAKEARLQADLASIGEKVQIQKEYQEAMAALQGANIEQKLWLMFEQAPGSLRRLFRLMVKEIVLEVEGFTRKARGKVVSYALADNFVPFGTNAEILGSKGTLIDLSRLLSARAELSVET